MLKKYLSGRLIRFADNMIYICRTKRLAEAALIAIQNFISIRGSEIKESKIRIINMYYHYPGTFNFLGAKFQKRDIRF